jgi:hypothetical protein
LMMERNRSPSGASGSLPYLLLILNVNSPKASLLKASFLGFAFRQSRRKVLLA